jgi:hypothetical protein
MKRTSLIALTVIAIAAIGAPTASAQKAPCTKQVSRLAPAIRSADIGGGLDLWVQKACGRRSALPFG